MKWLVAIFVLMLGGIAHADSPTSLFDGRLTIVLPDGFAVMPAEIAQAKYPNANRPKHIYSNASTTTSIAVELMAAKLTDTQLPDFQAFIERTMMRMIPGCKILTRDFVTIHGTRWARLELESNALDTEIHNLLLMAPLDGQPVMFNFNSTKEEFPKVKDALTKSMNSITIEATTGTQAAKPAQ